MIEAGREGRLFDASFGIVCPPASFLYGLAPGIVLPLLVGIRFQVLFHSPSGVLFTFPSRYWFTIGGRRYLALAGGPAGFPQGFSCPVVLGCLAKKSRLFRLQGFHPLWPAFPCRLARNRIFDFSPRSADPERKIPRPP